MPVVDTWKVRKRTESFPIGVFNCKNGVEEASKDIFSVNIVELPWIIGVVNVSEFRKGTETYLVDVFTCENDVEDAAKDIFSLDIVGLPWIMGVVDMCTVWKDLNKGVVCTTISEDETVALSVFLWEWTVDLLKNSLKDVLEYNCCTVDGGEAIVVVCELSCSKGPE